MRKKSMTWFSKNLGNVGKGEDVRIANEIQKVFPVEYGLAQFPQGMAVFSSKTIGAAQATVYFSPTAANLAIMFGATPCDAPTKDSVRLLCGDENNCWSANF
jgi:hypothetical protein